MFENLIELQNFFQYIYEVYTCYYENVQNNELEIIQFFYLVTSQLHDLFIEVFYDHDRFDTLMGQLTRAFVSCEQSKIFVIKLLVNLTSIERDDLIQKIPADFVVLVCAELDRSDDPEVLKNLLILYGNIFWVKNAFLETIMARRNLLDDLLSFVQRFPDNHLKEALLCVKNMFQNGEFPIEKYINVKQMASALFEKLQCKFSPKIGILLMKNILFLFSYLETTNFDFGGDEFFRALKTRHSATVEAFLDKGPFKLQEYSKHIMNYLDTIN